MRFFSVKEYAIREILVSLVEGSLNYKREQAASRFSDWLPTRLLTRCP
jgi:hypothetical protein